MIDFNSFGVSRVIEPKNSILYSAWKIDNSANLKYGEILIDVKILHLNRASFLEIFEEADGDEHLFKQRVIEIIHQRGKMHNPVTGTGGVLLGIVNRIGPYYINKYSVKPGDQIISMTSLTCTPLNITKINNIDFENADVYVEGYCVLYSGAPIIKRPEDIPVKQALSLFDEAGAPAKAYELVKENDKVLIIGATGRTGALVGFAVRKKLNGTGTVVGIVKEDTDKNKIANITFLDELMKFDASILDNLNQFGKLYQYGGIFDVVINCTTETGTEIAPLMYAKNKGTIFSPSLVYDYKKSILTAESMGKDFHFISYCGYVQNHGEFAIQLYRENEKLRLFMSSGANYNPNEAFATKANTEFSDKIKDIANQGFIFTSKRSLSCVKMALRVSQYNSAVLIVGESGTGKEILANIIHQNSPRKNAPIVKINCSSIPESLLESEFFGYEKGAFTGALSSGKKGLWEIANLGTIFLDEIGELPLSMQAKLLRAIQEKEITRVGGIKPIKIDVRIIAATNKDLELMVQKGQFREDLFYRLNVFPIKVPQLKERSEDIEPLAESFVNRFNSEFGMHKSLSKSGLNLIKAQPLKGNVRELQNLIQLTMINSRNDLIDTGDIIKSIQMISNKEMPQSQIIQTENLYGSTPPIASLDEILGQLEKETLIKYRKFYKTTTAMAEALKTSQPTIVRKLKKYGIE